MTDIRKHIVDDMSKHIAKDLTQSFKVHFHQLHAGGVSTAEAAAISAIVARSMLVACLGGAVIMTGSLDRKTAFALLLNQIVDDVISNEANIHANLDEAFARGAQRTMQ